MTAGNRDTSATWAFHDATKYVAARDAAGVERFLMGTAPELENPIWQEDRSLEPRPFKIYETLPHCRARTRPPPRRCPPWRRWPGPGGAAGLRVASRLWPRRRSDAGTAPGCGTSSPSSPPPPGSAPGCPRATGSSG